MRGAALALSDAVSVPSTHWGDWWKILVRGWAVLTLFSSKLLTQSLVLEVGISTLPLLVLYTPSW